MSLSQTQTTNVTVTADVQNNCCQIEHTFEVVCAVEFRHIQSINQSRIFRVVQVIKSLQDPLEVGNNLESYSVAPVAHDEMRNYQLSEQRIKSSRGHTSQKLSFLRCIF